MFRDSLVTGGALSHNPGFIRRYSVLSQVCLKVAYSYLYPRANNDVSQG